VEHGFDHRSDIRTEKRSGAVLAATVYGHMFIGLDNTKSVEQLADHHRKAGS
jgi:hypothetical protein